MCIRDRVCLLGADDLLDIGVVLTKLGVSGLAGLDDGLHQIHEEGVVLSLIHISANDDIHVLTLIFDTNTHDFCHSSRFFLMRSRHSSNRVISSSEKPL